MRFLACRVVVPKGLSERLAAKEFEGVLLDELAHVRWLDADRADPRMGDW